MTTHRPSKKTSLVRRPAGSPAYFLQRSADTWQAALRRSHPSTAA
jgi:hypothetical protein